MLRNKRSHSMKDILTLILGMTSERDVGKQKEETGFR